MQYTDNYMRQKVWYSNKNGGGQEFVVATRSAFILKKKKNDGMKERMKPNM